MGVYYSGMKTTNAMNVIGQVFASAAIGAGLILGGCDQKTPAPPASSSNNQPLGNLASNPQSVLGKSAQAGKNAAAGMQGTQDAAANAANQISGQGNEVVVGGLKFSVPEGWTAGTPNQFVKAKYTIPAIAGAEVSFSTAGGDVNSNLSRWRGQIKGSDGQPATGNIREETVGGQKITIYKAVGTYEGMSGVKQPNTAFRGAIIQMPSQSVFVKVTVPADKAAQIDSVWEQMVTGFSK